MYKRLESILSLVPKGTIVADIGTDHAQLPIMLVKRGICEKVYACDEKKGPLSIATENIKKENLSDKIITVLSDGFSCVPNDIDVAVIAGMGFYTAIRIIEQDKKRLFKLNRVILQVNQESNMVRKWISENHYTILDEKYVMEREKDYEIISFSGEKNKKELTLEQIYLGPVLMKMKTEDVLSYYKKREKKLLRLLNLKSKKDDSYASISQEYEILKEYIKKTC